MKKIIFLLLLTLTFYDCTRRTYCERKAAKVARILKDCPSIIDTTFVSDTVVIRDTISIDIPATIDSNSIDSLLREYCKENNKTEGNHNDNNKRERIIRKLIYKECSPEKVIGTGRKVVEFSGDSLTVEYIGKENGIYLKVISIKRKVNNTRTIVPPCDECGGVTDCWIYILVSASLGFIIGVISFAILRSR